MKTTKEYTLDILKRHYPKNLDYDKDFTAYIRTSEFKLLYKATGDFHGTQPIFEEKVNQLNKDLGLNFYRQMPGHLDRCISFQMKIAGLENHRVNLDISAIAPLFALFVIERRFDQQGFEKASFNREDMLEEMRAITAHTSYHFSHDFNKFRLSDDMRTLSSYITDHWNRHPLPIQLYNEKANSFSFDNSNGALTFYEALFQSSPMIQ